jgi:hypothetical protein
VILSVPQVICLPSRGSQHGHDRNETQAGRQEDGETHGEVHGAKDVSNKAHKALTFYSPRIS